MPVTLLESKKNVLEDLQMGVIDEFAKTSWLLNNLTFDEVISPVGGGSAWDYSYTRLDTQPEAEFRAVNTEFSAHEVEKKRYTATVSIMGGKYAIDRVIANTGGIVKETYLQSSQKIKAVRTLFQETVINGSTAVNPLAFDGLDTLLLGTSQEITTTVDLSSHTNIDTNWAQFQDELDMFIDELDGTPSALLVNKVTKQRILACARRASMYTTELDTWGRQVQMYNGIPIVDLGDKMATTDPIIGIDPATGTSPIYAVRLGMDGVHGICTIEGLPIRSWFPDYSTEGAVKKGEVEMLAGIVMKASKSAAVLRGLKVKA